MNGRTLTAAWLAGCDVAKSPVREICGIEFKGATYLTTFALPNFHFHVTTAYDILRHNGVEIGKLDFLGK